MNTQKTIDEVQTIINLIRQANLKCKILDREQHLGFTGNFYDRLGAVIVELADQQDFLIDIRDRENNNAH